VERTSSRAGVAPAEVQRLSRRTFSPTIGQSQFVTNPRQLRYHFRSRRTGFVRFS
jgi:hypothetical protein